MFCCCCLLFAQCESRQSFNYSKLHISSRNRRISAWLTYLVIDTRHLRNRTTWLHGTLKHQQPCWQFSFMYVGYSRSFVHQPSLSLRGKHKIRDGRHQPDINRKRQIQKSISERFCNYDMYQLSIHQYWLSQCSNILHDTQARKFRRHHTAGVILNFHCIWLGPKSKHYWWR